MAHIIEKTTKTSRTHGHPVELILSNPEDTFEVT